MPFAAVDTTLDAVELSDDDDASVVTFPKATLRSASRSTLATLETSASLSPLVRFWDCPETSVRFDDGEIGK